MNGATSSLDPSRLPRFHPLAVDAALTIVAGAAILLGVLHAGHHLSGLEQPASTAAALITYAATPLRRRWPWASSTAVVVATTGYLTAGGHYWWIIPAPAVVLFHLASTGRPRVKLTVVALACGALLLGVPALSSPGIWWSGGGHEPSVAVFAACCIALAAGDAVRNRRAYLAEVEERACQAERERTRHAREQVTHERIRIARDLHDNLGHHLALINAQAGMAARIFDTQPDAARAALAHITTESRTALDDMRATVGLLRQPDDPATSTEVPGLRTVADLVERYKRSGMLVDLTVDGDPCPVPTGVDLAAYRIVQESLTNASKHSTGAAIRVRIGYTPDAVTVLVDTEPSTNAAPINAAPIVESDGHGLVGMRERASAAGGQLRAGPRPDGGYQVRADLPLTRTARP